MLEVSRKELEEQVPKALQNSTKYRRGIYFFIEDYIIEPIATGLRFLHLMIIFVPVIVTIPAIWIGSRQPDRDNERSGTLWWYGYLVLSMERAGAAFIKACREECDRYGTETDTTVVRAMGCIANRRIPYRDVLHHVDAPFQRTRAFAQGLKENDPGRL
jgi:hypothetical protein